MPAEDVERGSPEEWLARAKSNLILWKTPKRKDLYWEERCFNLQQVVEKALKAVLLYKGISFPYTHEIIRLVVLVKRAGICWPSELDNADDLSDYAVEARYPGGFESVMEEGYHQAVRIADDVLDWAKTIIEEENHNVNESPSTESVDSMS